MSTVADILPYMQNWLDARAALAASTTTWTAARTSVTAARTAISARVAAGDTALAMSALVTTYITARGAYITQDAIQRAAVDLTNARWATLGQMEELLATGQDVPVFGG